MLYSIGMVSREAGVSTETLRRWEAARLIPPAQRKYIARWRVWQPKDVKIIVAVANQRLDS